MTLLTPDELAAIRERIRRAALDDPAHEAGTLAMICDDLFAHIDALTPRWRDGEPPEGSGWMWRKDEYREQPVETRHDSDGHAGYYDGEGTPEPWGAARWCPIRGPG